MLIMVSLITCTTGRRQATGITTFGWRAALASGPFEAHHVFSSAGKSDLPLLNMPSGFSRARVADISGVHPETTFVIRARSCGLPPGLIRSTEYPMKNLFHT
jgi:hypothetical protein